MSDDATVNVQRCKTLRAILAGDGRKGRHAIYNNERTGQHANEAGGVEVN